MSNVRRDLMIESDNGDNEVFKQGLAALDRTVEELGKLGLDVRVEHRVDKRRQYKRNYLAARPAEVIDLTDAD